MASVVDPRVDLYCHKTLKGCGTVFLGVVPQPTYDSEGDPLTPRVECPVCNRNLGVLVTNYLSNSIKYT